MMRGIGSQCFEVVAGQLRAFVLMNAARDVLEAVRMR